MKIISLNTFGGTYFNPLMEFAGEHAETTDVFCFQEMFSTCSRITESNGARVNLYQELSSKLGFHSGRFAPSQDGYDFEGEIDFGLSYGLAQFVKNNMRLGGGEEFIIGTRNSRTGDSSTNPRNLQYVILGFNGGVYGVVHFHGLWNGQGKDDSDLRLLQSVRVRDAIAELPGQKILCGDFNLNPETESLRILEEGMVNLIKKYGIIDTRGKLYTKQGRYANYMLVSPELEKRIKKFEVPPVEVSDHLPLILELE